MLPYGPTCAGAAFPHWTYLPSSHFYPSSSTVEEGAQRQRLQAAHDSCPSTEVGVMYCITCPWCSFVHSFKQMLSHIIFCYTGTRHVLQYTVFGEDKRLRKCTLRVPRPDSIIPSKLYFTKCIAFGHKLNNLSRQRLVRLVTVQTLGCVRSHGST